MLLNGVLSKNCEIEGKKMNSVVEVSKKLNSVEEVSTKIE